MSVDRGLMTISEASEKLGVSPETVRLHVHKGFVRASRFRGGRASFFISSDDFTEYARKWVGEKGSRRFIGELSSDAAEEVDHYEYEKKAN
jgi:excisionase family DNA binding protein